MINLIYYKNILDRVFLNFIREYESSFIKSDDKYVFGGGFSKSVIKNILKSYIVFELNQLVSEWNPVDPQYYFIIGGCNPKNNLLLNFNTNKIPNKLDNIIKSDKNIKYLLVEDDIVMDFEAINKILDEIFNMFFKYSSNRKKSLLGNNKNNVIFITHNRLDCYSLFKIIKFIYGRSNCNNLFIEKYVNHRNVLVAINDMIDKYVTNKCDMNKSAEFKQYINEIKLFLDAKMNFTLGV